MRNEQVNDGQDKCDWAIEPSDEQIVSQIEELETWQALHSNLSRPEALLEYERKARPGRKQKDRKQTAEEKAYDFAFGWYLKEFSSAEVREWFQNGMTPRELGLALELRVVGVKPDMLTRPIEHPVTKSPSTVLEVARSAIMHFDNAVDALDAAGFATN